MKKDIKTLRKEYGKKNLSRTDLQVGRWYVNRRSSTFGRIHEITPLRSNHADEEVMLEILPGAYHHLFVYEFIKDFLPASLPPPSVWYWNDGVCGKLLNMTMSDSSMCPLLADALEEAGCYDPLLLDALRSGVAWSARFFLHTVRR